MNLKAIKFSLVTQVSTQSILTWQVKAAGLTQHFMRLIFLFLYVYQLDEFVLLPESLGLSFIPHFH